MVLNIIGIGLGDEKDITLKGFELVKKSDIVYLENYTSKLNCDVSKLEKLYGKKIILANRNLVENKTEIVDNAVKKDVSLLIIGDVFGATTHIDIVQRAREKKIKINIVHNTSIINAVGETGLSLYKFGRVTSIPFDNKDIVSPIKVFEENSQIELHTLFLLDLRPDENKFMSVNEAIEYLLKNKVDENKMAVACCAMGSDKQIIKYGKLKELKYKKFDVYPQCLIIPGKMHFMEEEFLEFYKL
jgi:diphthine synthase